MVACTEDTSTGGFETRPSDNAIVFGTFLDKAPQASAASPSGITPLASVLTTDGLKASDAGFTVLAYSTGNTAWSDYYSTAPATPDFMDNQPVTWNTDRWVYTPIKYWPGAVDGTNPDKVSFFGLSTVGGATATGVENGNPKIAYTVAATAAAQHDLVADAALDATGADGKVKFQFDHILSRIGFTAKLAADYTPATITVNSLKVYYAAGEVNNSGTYTFNTTTTNTDADNWELGATYFDEATTGAGDPVFSGAAILTAAATNLSAPDNFLMHIPQAVEDGNVYVELDWSLKQSSPDLTIPYTTTINLPTVTWAPGKAYTYNFTLALNAVEFDTQIGVNPWGDNKDIPAPPVFSNGTDESGSAIDAIRAAQGQPSVYIALTSEPETVNLSSAQDIGASGLQLTTDNSPAAVVIDGGGRVISLGNSGTVITVGSGVTLTLRNITFKGNSSNNSSLIVVDSGTLILENGAVITGNKGTAQYGGGVYLDNGGSFTMNGGVISDNKAQYGGGVLLNGGTLTIGGSAKIINNEATESGGGVSVGSGGSFTMTGEAVISGNTAKAGGGVYIGSGGSFTMSSEDAVISSNHATAGAGGGVYVGSDGRFTMQAGIIYGVKTPALTNTATTDNGAAVYVNDGESNVATTNNTVAK
jgi:hypothetical protein